MRYMWVFGAVFVIIAIWFLAIGLRGIITKRPTIFPARRNFWLMALCLLPSFIFPAQFLLNRQTASLPYLALLFPLLLYCPLLVLMWKAMRGYIIIGITEESLRDALHDALEKLQLPFEESLAKLRLTTLDADLSVAMQAWMGTAQLRIKGTRHDEVLKKIAEAMNDSLAHSSTRMNLTTNIFYVITGVTLIILAIFLSVIGWHLSSLLDEPPDILQPQALHRPTSDLKSDSRQSKLAECFVQA